MECAGLFLGPDSSHSKLFPQYKIIALRPLLRNWNTNTGRVRRWNRSRIPSTEGKSRMCQMNWLLGNYLRWISCRCQTCIHSFPFLDVCWQKEQHIYCRVTDGIKQRNLSQMWTIKTIKCLFGGKQRACLWWLLQNNHSYNVLIIGGFRFYCDI